MVKNSIRTANFLKRIISVMSAIAKAKSIMAIKGKADAVKNRPIVFSLLKNKKLSLGSISHKIHAILGQQEKKSLDDEHVTAGDDMSKAIVLYSANANDHDATNSTTEEDDKYPDLTHSLFDDDDDDLGDDPNASVIDLVRNSKEEGENFSLEDEIDHVADLFIKKFHKRIRMQKLESFKRYQEMLERST